MWIGPVEATVSPRGSRTSDPAVGSFARADAESADGNCKRPQVRAFDFFFLLIDTVCARTFQTQRHQKWVKCTFSDVQLHT